MAQESFQPWVGKHYNETKLLLLGRSAYSWQDENRQWRHPTLNHPTETVREVLDDFSRADGMPFMKMLSRGLAGEEEPSKKLLHRVWHRVAFTNYVGGTTGKGPGKPATSDMWKVSKAAYRPNILNKLRPRRIIVIGKVMWSQMPEANVYMTDDVQGYLFEDGSVAMCWALPGRGLSWTRLADTIHFALGRELPRRSRFPGDGE